MVSVNYYCFSQNTELNYFVKNGYKMKCVKSFKDLKKVTNSSRLKGKSLIYKKTNNFIQGFLFLESGELPNFFVATDDKFVLFLSDIYSAQADTYRSVLINLYSIYNLEYKNATVYYTNVSNMFPNNSIPEVLDIYEFKRNNCLESVARLKTKMPAPNFLDTLANYSNYKFIDKSTIESKEFVSTNKIDRYLKPSILLLLNDIYKSKTK